MKLELIISPSGFGKTHFIVNDIEKNRFNSKIIVLTPEQNSFNFEKILCEKFGGTFDIDVMNFSSLSRKFSGMLGVDYFKSIGEDIKPFYFYKAAKNLENRNNFLVKRILQDSSFIEVVSDILRELKEYQVSVNVLEEFLENNISLDNARREKLTAILEIYTEYTRLSKEDSIFDKQDYINELLLYSEYLDLSEYIFYIDAYYNFTAQEYSYIEKLILKSKKVVLSVVSDANRYFNFDLTQIAAGYDLDKLEYNRFYLADLYKYEKYKLDVFRKSHEMVASINEVLRRNSKIDFSVIAIINNGETYTINLEISENKVVNYNILNEHSNRFKGKSILTLADKYYKAFKSANEVDNSVEIIRSKNKELEVKTISREILRLKKYQEVNNEDIAILYRDSIYENYEYIFRDYGLEIHLDRDIDVSNHRLIKFLDQALNIESFNFRDGILNIIKTNLTNFEYLYKLSVLSYVLFGDNKITEKDFYKNYKSLEKEELISKLALEENLINHYFKEYTFNEILNSVKTITTADLENILEERLVVNKEDLNKEYFTKGSSLYSTKQLEILRDLLINLYEKIEAISKSKNLQIKRYIRRIEDLFDYCNIRMYLDKEDGEYDDIEELKVDSIDRQVYKKTLELLNNILERFGSENITYNKFVELLIIGLKSIKYRSIPEISDSIIMSTMDLAKVENKKYVFVIGFNKDVLPATKQDGLLDDNDKEQFIDNSIFLSPTTGSALIDEEFVAYIALTRATTKTYISYSLLDKSFKESFPSPYLAVVKNLLSGIEEKNTDRILEFNLSYYDYYLDNIDKILTIKEFNYLFSKLYRRFMDIKDSGTEEVEKLSKVLAKFLENYVSIRKVNANLDYVVHGELTDKIYIDKDDIVINYLEKVIKDYKFELSENNIQDFLSIKNNNFSKFSISKVSDYEKNPYLFFVKRILGIKEETKVEIDSLLMGRFFHAVMSDDRVVNFIVRSGSKIDIDIVSDEDIVSRFNIRQVVNEVIYNNTSNDIIDVLNIISMLNTHDYILQNMINRLIIAISVEIKYYAITKFTPTFLEKEFSLEIHNDVIRCRELGSNKVVEKSLSKKYNIPPINFVGFIDRVDVLEKNISVIDYKSSKTDFSLESLELGFISQILTYSLACEMLFNKKSEDILGIFYREIAKLGKTIKDYRLRGLGNSDLILQSEFSEATSEVMFLRTTKKGTAIHGADVTKAYTSKELDTLVEKNLHNVLTLLEEIYNFDFSLEKYEIVNNEYYAEKQTLFNYASGTDTRLTPKVKVESKGKELRQKILGK